MTSWMRNATITRMRTIGIKALPFYPLSIPWVSHSSFQANFQGATSAPF
jgi:hypothetical protein